MPFFLKSINQIAHVKVQTCIYKRRKWKHGGNAERGSRPRAGTDPTAAFVVHEKCLLLGNETLSVAKTAERRELSLQAAAGPGRIVPPAAPRDLGTRGFRGPGRQAAREASAGDSDARRRAPGAVWSAPHARRRGSLRGGGRRRKVPRREAGAVESGRGSLSRRKRAPKQPPARRRVGLPAGPPLRASSADFPPPTAYSATRTRRGPSAPGGDRPCVPPRPAARRPPASARSLGRPRGHRRGACHRLSPK